MNFSTSRLHSLRRSLFWDFDHADGAAPLISRAPSQPHLTCCFSELFHSLLHQLQLLPLRRELGAQFCNLVYPSSLW